MNLLTRIGHWVSGRSFTLVCPRCPASVKARGVSREKAERLRDHMARHVTTHLDRS